MGSVLVEPLLRPAPTDAATSPETLRRTLRALWGIDAAVFEHAGAPHLAQGAIHLPAQAPPGADPGWHLAAAAHAAAHLVFSPPVFDGRGLKPIVRALVGVLEDARVESLAGRELPGLQRGWRQRHTATPLDGAGVDVLLLRLARALADPDYDDPHPWVRKGRTLFFLDAQGLVLAEPRAERLCTIASRLGHDLGQMRLQFDARGHRPGPDYRDDHRWMWPQASGDEAQLAPPPPDGRSAPQPDRDEPATPHPEWDRLIARLRPAWCRVLERPAAAGAAATATAPATAPRGLRRALLGRHATGRWRLQHDGPELDLDALVRARIARRRGRSDDGRLHRARGRERRAGSALLLIDQSASTSAAWLDGARSQLQAGAELAWHAARSLAGVGLQVAIAGFSSNGRHAVRWQRLLAFGEAPDGACRARLGALASGGSTRLGAALRHAVRELARRRDGERIVLVISDADSHDVDVHDPRYLADDARHAVRHARRQGLRVGCLLTDPQRSATARHLFGAAGLATPRRLDELPRALARLLG